MAEQALIVFGRGLWLHIFEPWGGNDPSDQDKDPKRQMTLAFPPDSPDLARLKVAANGAFARGWPQEKPAGAPHNPFVPAAEKGKIWEAPGWVLVKAKSGFVVGVYDESDNRVMDPNDPRFYDGAWYNASIAPFAFNTRGNWGITFVLNAVQKAQDDEHIGGSGASPFGAIAGAVPPEASPFGQGAGVPHQAPAPPQQPQYQAPPQQPQYQALPQQPQKGPGGIPY